MDVNKPFTRLGGFIGGLARPLERVGCPLHARIIFSRGCTGPWKAGFTPIWIISNSMQRLRRHSDVDNVGLAVITSARL